MTRGNHFAHQKQHARHFNWRRIARISVIVFGCLILLNLSLVFMYRNKVVPRTHLGSTRVGGMSYTSVQNLPASAGIESQITLKHNTTNQKVQPSDLGLSVDRTAATQRLKSNITVKWLPIVALIKPVTVPVVLKIDSTQFSTGLQKLSSQFEQTAQDIHIAFNGQTFAMAPASNGYKINETSTKQLLLDTVAKGQTIMQVPITVVKPTVHSTDLSGEVTKLNKQLATTVSFGTYGGTKVVPTTVQKAAWYQQNNQTMVLSRDNIGAYLDQVTASQKVSILNRTDLITAAMYALNHQQSLDFRMIVQGNIKRTYCTAVRGVDPSELGDLNDKLAAVYADVRGWNDEGLLGFEHVDSSCSYTVYLSAASQMTSFGSICDDYYNCQVGGNVVVNDDRWTTATPPWNATGGNIEDYRILIIDHETGHRLGFYDNPVCPGAGQPAFVMMQQSIDLKGCTFNVWPTATELTDLKSML